MDPKRRRDSDSSELNRLSPFPDEVLERVLALVKSDKDRSSVSLVCKDWYNAERWTRTHVFIGNCYSVSPEIVARRFPKLRSVTLKGKPRFSDFNLVPENWGADIYQWLVVFATAYPFLEELRLKRMAVTDEGLEYLATTFPNFKALSLLSCDGFSTDGLAAIATHCKNLTELDVHENGIEDTSGGWLSCFPESFTSLEVLNFASLHNDVSFDSLERLVGRCKSLRVLKVNKNITLEQLQKLLIRAPQLMEIGTGTFQQELVPPQYAEIESAFSRCRNLHTLSGLSEATSVFLPLIYNACAHLTFLNLSYATLGSSELAKLLEHCPNLRRLWLPVAMRYLCWRTIGVLHRSNVFRGVVSMTTFSSTREEKKRRLSKGNLSLRSIEFPRVCERIRTDNLWLHVQVLDTVGDKGLEAVGSSCPFLEELRVFPADPFDLDMHHGVTETGFIAVSQGCRRLHYVLYFCRQMTNAAVATVVQNCPDFTHFRLCIMHPGQPDYLTNEPMDEAFGAVVKTCTKLQRLAVSGLLTDLTFEYIGKYAKNMETLSVAFAGSSDWGMECVLAGCPKLRKLEIRDCPFGNAALLSGLDKYESMRSLWMSACNVTMNGCRLLAREMPRLNVEVMKDDESDESHADKVYVYRTVAGPRRDAPPFVLTL